MYPQSTSDFKGISGNYSNVFQGIVAPNVYAGISPNISAPAPQANFSSVADPAWYINSGATTHVTYDAGIFSQYSAYSGAEKLYVGDGMGLSICNI